MSAAFKLCTACRSGATWMIYRDHSVRNWQTGRQADRRASEHSLEHVSVLPGAAHAHWQRFMHARKRCPLRARWPRAPSAALRRRQHHRNGTCIYKTEETV
jgi:hypothetical protein